MRSIRVPAIAALFFCTLSSPSTAQTVFGTVADAESGAALDGAVVALLDEAGDPVAGTLSRADGGFLIRAPGPGRYRLAARMIGYRSVETPSFTLAEGEMVERTIEATVRAIGLEGITAEVRPRCEPRPDASRDAQRLWAEAKTALTAVSLTQNAESIWFTARGYRQLVELETGWLMDEEARRITSFRGQPFRSVPVDRLVAEGFVRQRQDTTIYYAPDARALLSDTFLSTHCFWAVEGDGDRVGLAFEPVPERRRLREIEGVLWLDRETARLRDLEFRYTDMAAARPHDLGGDVDFQRLANGAWIIRRWRIRMPFFATVANRGTRRLVGIQEEGGEVLEVHGLGTRRVFVEPTGHVEGRLVSEAGVPLGEALVYLSGTVHADTTDADGRFAFMDVHEGRYALAWYDVELAAVNGPPEPREIDVAAGETTSLRVTAGDADRWSPPEPVADDTVPALAGVVAGIVVDAETDEPIAGAMLRLVDTEHRAESDDAGRFAMADVEPGRYTLEVERIGYGTQSETIEVPGEGALRLRVKVAPTALQLAPLAVDARSATLVAVGFYDRRANGLGAFLTRDDIERQPNDRLSAIVARVAGMQRTFGRQGTVTFDMRGQETLMGDCRTQFFVDGVPSELGARGIDDVPSEAVEGIEIYRGASEVPMRFTVGRAACGAVVIWTRTGR